MWGDAGDAGDTGDVASASRRVGDEGDEGEFTLPNAQYLAKVPKASETKK